MTEDFLTAAEKAENAFNRRLAELGIDVNHDLAIQAWENTFSAEVYSEYRDDAHRWEIALATLDMLIDQGGKV